jgi:tRNA-Thr(GGU) m(6)t(6)A37 methyltransferase TsaA
VEEEEEEDGAGMGDGDCGDALDGGDESGEKGATARATAAKQREVTTMLMTSIGTVASPFVKRMGTPRQPQLAPSARGYVEFHRRGAGSPSSLDGIGEYSHAWILFEFHANTNNNANGGSGSGGTGGGTKIRPPRAPPHVKVGQLASRSPHRPNPIGLSLVRIDKWDAATRRLHVSGLDLVHGTPVYDVKPYVPWDAPGYCCRGGGGDEDRGDAPSAVRVPAWVSQEDELARVELTGEAERQLRGCVQAGRLAPFYPPDRGGGGEGLEAARSLLAEVLRQDPRGSHRGGGKGGDRRGEESSPGGAGDGYSLLLGRCRVFFAVSPSAGLVTVTRVEGADLDPATTPHAEGVPLLMVPANAAAAAAGRSGGTGAGPSG